MEVLYKIKKEKKKLKSKIAKKAFYIRTREYAHTYMCTHINWPKESLICFSFFFYSSFCLTCTSRLEIRKIIRIRTIIRTHEMIYFLLSCRLIAIFKNARNIVRSVILYCQPTEHTLSIESQFWIRTFIRYLTNSCRSIDE